MQYLTTLTKGKLLKEVKDSIKLDTTRPIKRLYDDKVTNAHRNARRLQGGGDRPLDVPWSSRFGRKWLE